ncbi:hypothetical protein CYG49_00310 [Candidatus Saccharibacteria bacterium]|nr:MAG: hypothetical protein CYG49_00310 [Candidatus Saccharibacteria bacterium]
MQGQAAHVEEKVADTQLNQVDEVQVIIEKAVKLEDAATRFEMKVNEELGRGWTLITMSVRLGNEEVTDGYDLTVYSAVLGRNRAALGFIA